MVDQDAINVATILKDEVKSTDWPYNVYQRHSGYWEIIFELWPQEGTYGNRDLFQFEYDGVTHIILLDMITLRTTSTQRGIVSIRGKPIWRNMKEEELIAKALKGDYHVLTIGNPIVDAIRKNGERYTYSEPITEDILSVRTPTSDWIREGDLCLYNGEFCIAHFGKEKYHPLLHFEPVWRTMEVREEAKIIANILKSETGPTIMLRPNTDGYRYLENVTDDAYLVCFKVGSEGYFRTRVLGSTCQVRGSKEGVRSIIVTESAQRYMRGRIVERFVARSIIWRT